MQDTWIVWKTLDKIKPETNDRKKGICCTDYLRLFRCHLQEKGIVQSNPQILRIPYSRALNQHITAQSLDPLSQKSPATPLTSPSHREPTSTVKHKTFLLVLAKPTTITPAAAWKDTAQGEWAGALRGWVPRSRIQYLQVLGSPLLR